MMMVGRKYGALGRYGFNGKEQDPDVKGSGAQYDYGFRIYDNRIGRFLSIDPLFKSYPFYTPYQFAANMPIAAIDLEGAEPLVSFKYGTVTKDRTAIEVVADVKIIIQIINLSDIANSEMNLDAVAFNLKSDLENKLSGSSTAMWDLPFIFKSKGNTITGVDIAKNSSEFKNYKVTYTTKVQVDVSVVNDISKIDNEAWAFGIIDEVQDGTDRKIGGQAYSIGSGKVAIGEAADFTLSEFSKNGRNTIFHEILHLLGASDTYPPNSGYPGTENPDNAMYSTDGKMNLTQDQLVKEIWTATIGDIFNIFNNGINGFKQPKEEPDKQPTQEQLKQFIQQNGTASKIKD